MCKKSFIKYIVILVIIFLTAGTASAITLTVSPNPAALNKPVTFKMKVETSNPPCIAYIDFGEGAGFVNVGAIVNTSNTFQVTHTYAQAGVYTVIASAAVDCGAGVVSPTTVTMTLRVSDFEIKRIETTFENGEPQITLQRNEPAPELSAKITFSGSGFLKGYWEVDGNKSHYFFKQLSIGPETVIQYPGTPPLKTYIPGSHVVRFVITQPTMDIAFPKVVYYVTPEDYLKLSNIRLLTPQPGEILNFEPFTFTWQNIPATKVYLINIFSKTKDIPVFSAYAIQNKYTLKTPVLNKFLEPGKSYSIQVLGFLEDTRMSGKSEKTPLIFKK